MWFLKTLLVVSIPVENGQNLSYIQAGRRVVCRLVVLIMI